MSLTLRLCLADGKGLELLTRKLDALLALLLLEEDGPRARLILLTSVLSLDVVTHGLHLAVLGLLGALVVEVGDEEGPSDKASRGELGDTEAVLVVETTHVGVAVQAGVEDKAVT
jgi:hypothetical protein